MHANKEARDFAADELEAMAEDFELAWECRNDCDMKFRQGEIVGKQWKDAAGFLRRRAVRLRTGATSTAT